MTRRALFLHLLREAGPRGVTTAELLQAGVGSRYSARLLELRAEGHVVESERIRDGAWRYTLTHDADQTRVPVRPVDVPPPAPIALFEAAPVESQRYRDWDGEAA